MRVLFINDVGFQYGAGLAQLRQIQSFLLKGHDVTALCWTDGDTESRVPLLPNGAAGRWLGIHSFPYLHPDLGIPPDMIVECLVFETQARNPDVIIVGNLHGAKWPLQLLSALRSVGCPVIAYMHDCYLFTGRCAYTGGCTLYTIGCNAQCPTWDQYPTLEPSRIFGEWLLRRNLFCGSNGIPLATNSQWLLQQVQDALVGVHQVDCLYLGLDEHLFKPIDQQFARRLLGIPEDCFVVLGGAANVNDTRKGGHIFRELVETLKRDVYFLLFGAQSDKQSSVYGTGLLRDYRKMPILYSAADVFVNTSLEEAFGQTLCEASACQLPIVSFRVGGVPEIARDTVNARLVEEKSARALLNEIVFLKQRPTLRHEYGQAGRAFVEAEFTLEAQGTRWERYLGCATDPVEHPQTLLNPA